MGTTNHHEVVEADIVQTSILHETVSLSNRTGFPLELSDMIEVSLYYVSTRDSLVYQSIAEPLSNQVTYYRVVAERLCFHRCLSFCSHGVPACTGADIPPDRHPLADTPPPPTATAVEDTHPTGMPSCFSVQVFILT